MTTLEGLYNLRLIQIEVYLFNIQGFCRIAKFNLRKEFSLLENELMEERKVIREFLNKMELEKLCKQN